MTFLIPHLLAGPLIPISIDWLHCPWINATVHSLSGSDERIPMLLSSVGGYSMIGRSNWDNTTVSLSTTDGEYITPPNVVFANVCYGSCSLSLGPRSGLTNAYGSTTVIKFHNDKDHGLLSLGVRDLSEFESLCIPDSLIAISSFATRATFRSPWVITHYFSFIFYLYEEECMTVPAPFAERVVELLQLSGAFQTSTKVFENCNSRSLANLPDIELELGEPVAGSIVLSATDYVAINSSTNTCHLRFSVGPAFQQIGINFYAIPGLNVRITQDQIQLCDSAL